MEGCCTQAGLLQLAEEPSREAALRLIKAERDNSDDRAMMDKFVERHQRLRALYDGVDVITLDETHWQEWLSVHHIFEQFAGKGRRQNHRQRLKMAAKEAGEPWIRNDPRARTPLSS